MDLLRFDPTDCFFPKPRIPVLPAINPASLGRSSNCFKPLSTGTSTRFYSRGRYALKEAYRLAGVCQTGALLAPSYHCRTMIDPAIRLNACIELYPLTAELAPDMHSLANRLASCRSPVKALLATHFFGFPRDFAMLAEFCEKHNIVLIEDCSHAMIIQAQEPTHQNSESLGKTGRYCVASPYKFFPCQDGGLLWANHEMPSHSTQTIRPTFVQECRGLLDLLGKTSDQTSTLDIHSIGEKIKLLSESPISRGHELNEKCDQISINYHIANENQSSLAVSRCIVRNVNVDRLARLRRQHYQKWAEAVSDLPYCRALYPYLTDGTVPYMFPLQIDYPEMHFFLLKKMGVPIWRWDDMAVSGCAVAANYRLRLLHLPCHQELSPEQMTWMISTLRQVMHQSPRQNC